MTSPDTRPLKTPNTPKRARQEWQGRARRSPHPCEGPCPLVRSRGGEVLAIGTAYRGCVEGKICVDARPAADEPQETSIYPSRWRALLFCVLAVGLLVGWGQGVMRGEGWGKDAVHRFAGLCLLPILSAILAFVGMHRLVFPSPILVLNCEGLQDQSWFLSPSLVPWEEIDVIFDQDVHGIRSMVIRLRNPGDFAARQPNLTRLAMGVSRHWNGGQIAVNMNWVSGGFDTVAAHIRRYSSVEIRPYRMFRD